MKSRQWPKITVQGENHGNHGLPWICDFLTALEISSPGNRHCANCIGTLSLRTDWCKGVAGCRRLVAQPGGLTSGLSLHLVSTEPSGVTSHRQPRQCRGPRGPKRRFELALEVQSIDQSIFICSKCPEIHIKGFSIASRTTRLRPALTASQLINYTMKEKENLTRFKGGPRPVANVCREGQTL